ncbi:MAG: TIGR02646 family protein [Candidatus Parabeggiatoa sp. nov. 3]|nr:MAG: TIGR02646 family protein [Gammaproteobacteria bacterium]RKZ56283.1 MAG: TIGR02646 family protein [Gammaproteobacteria bacterium]RKZ79743.1 MAG: TIGR02646 family protein [Gammaproteobacteria bacterium]
MRYIDKSNCCAEFDKYVNNDSPSVWDEFKTDIKLKLHQHLWREQQGLCIYCQQEVPEKKETEYKIRSHIEHIRPRRGHNPDKYAHLIFCYKNLSVSCEGFDCKMDDSLNPKKEFCEHNKENEYDEYKFLNPVECRDIEDYFSYGIDGTIHPNNNKNDEDKSKAQYMIKTLYLNHPTLTDMRKKQYQLIIQEQEKGLDIKDFLNPHYELPGFYTMLKQLFLQLGV